MLLVAVLVAPLVALVIHEAGHALAAWALGARDVRVRPIPWGACVEATLASDGRRAAFLLAGPAASALAGAGGVALGGPWAVLGVVSALFAVLTLLGSDGRQAARMRGALARFGTRSNSIAGPASAGRQARG